MFELSSLILNWSTFISALMVIFRELEHDEEYEDIAHNVVGIFFFLTIVLGIYLMLVTTVRAGALVRVRFLDVLLIGLLVGTIIASLISFLHL
jgi:ubiquitin C